MFCKPPTLSAESACFTVARPPWGRRGRVFPSSIPGLWYRPLVDNISIFLCSRGRAQSVYQYQKRVERDELMSWSKFNDGNYEIPSPTNERRACTIYSNVTIHVPIRSQYLCPGNYRPFEATQGNTVTFAVIININHVSFCWLFWYQHQIPVRFTRYHFVTKSQHSV